MKKIERLEQANAILTEALVLACKQITKLNFVYDDEKQKVYIASLYKYFIHQAERGLK